MPVRTLLETESLESVDVFVVILFVPSILVVSIVVWTSVAPTFVLSPFVAIETILLRLVEMIWRDAPAEKTVHVTSGFESCNMTPFNNDKGIYHLLNEIVVGLV